MLFRQPVLEDVREGRITLAFRRWRQSRVRKGTRIRTGIGLVQIESIDEVTPEQISERDAWRAGFATREALLAELGQDQSGSIVYRIELEFAGPDPREALRSRASIDAGEARDLIARLARFDAASPDGPWTRRVLETIAKRPAVRAAALAARLKRDTRTFKMKVRKLKELGLTESLEVGYRLSPRGRELLRRLQRQKPAPARRR
jgi:hypothetical protein